MERSCHQEVWDKGNTPEDNPYRLKAGRHG